MTRKIIFILFSLLFFFSCNRVKDKSLIKKKSLKELKVEILQAETIENSLNDFRLTDKNII